MPAEPGGPRRGVDCQVDQAADYDVPSQQSQQCQDIGDLVRQEYPVVALVDLDVLGFESKERVRDHEQELG